MSDGELSRAFGAKGKGVERGSLVQRRVEEVSGRESVMCEKEAAEGFK